MKSFILTKVIFIIILISKFSGASAQSNQLFDGYKTMELPRDKVPLGSIWTDIGPVGGGVDEVDLDIADSFSLLSKIKHHKVDGTIEANMLSYLQGKLGSDYLSNAKVQLKSVSVVKVKNLNLLKNNIGNKILYEAIRANEIAFEIDSDLSSQLKIDLLKVFSGSNISVGASLDNKSLLTASGTNLFIAYRVIELSSGKEKSKKVSFKNQSASSSRGVKISPNYYINYKNFNVSLCPCAVLECIKQGGDVSKCVNNNQWLITVVDSKNISLGTPKKEYIYRSLPFDIWNENIPLKNELTSEGLNITYLNIEHLYFDLVNSVYGYLVMKGDNERVKIVENEIVFKNVPVVAKNGW